MATRKTQQSSHLRSEVEGRQGNLILFEKLVEKLLRKDAIPPPKTYYQGKCIQDHLTQINRYLHLSSITDDDGKISVLLNSLDDDIQVLLFSQPQFESHSQDFNWICDKLLCLLQQKASPLSPLAKLLHVKQKEDQSLSAYATELRIAAYRCMKNVTETTKEHYLLTAFLKGMTNRTISTAIEALRPNSLEDAVKMAQKEEKCHPSDSCAHLRAINSHDVVINRDMWTAILNQLSLLQKQVNYLISLQQPSSSDQVGNRQFMPPQQRSNLPRGNQRPITHEAPYRNRSIQCFTCNQTGHIARNCPQTRPRPSPNQQRRIQHFRGIHSLETEDLKKPQERNEENSSQASKDSDNEDAYSQEPECLFLSPSTKTKSRKFQSKPPKKMSESERSAEEWTLFIKGKGKRPKKPTPTLISQSRQEPASNKPLILGQCEGEPAKVFLDSGAEVNVIDKEYFNRLKNFCGDKVLFKPQKGAIVCANGSKMTTHGTALLKLHVGRSSANIKFTVADSMFPRLVVGIRGMKTLNIQLDPANSRALVNGSEVIPFISKVYPESVFSGNDPRSTQGAGVGPRN